MANPVNEVIKEKTLSGSDILQARNITENTINLTYCSIKPGDTGKVTRAEISSLHEYLEAV